MIGVIKCMLAATWALRSKKAAAKWITPTTLKYGNIFIRWHCLYLAMLEYWIEKSEIPHLQKGAKAGDRFLIDSRGNAHADRVLLVIRPAYRDSFGFWHPPKTIDVTGKFERGNGQSSSDTGYQQRTLRGKAK